MNYNKWSLSKINQGDTSPSMEWYPIAVAKGNLDRKLDVFWRFMVPDQWGLGTKLPTCKLSVREMLG